MGDAERERAIDRVGSAYAEGLLEVEELERAVEALLRARTRGDVEAVTRVLPQGWLAEAARSEAAAHRRDARRAAHRHEVRSYLGVMGLLVGIWSVVAVTAGATYFWPIWPALGWGVPLLVSSLGRRDTDGASSRRPVPQTGAQARAWDTGNRSSSRCSGKPAPSRTAGAPR